MQNKYARIDIDLENISRIDAINSIRLIASIDLKLATFLVDSMRIRWSDGKQPIGHIVVPLDAISTKWGVMTELNSLARGAVTISTGSLEGIIGPHASALSIAVGDICSSSIVYAQLEPTQTFMHGTAYDLFINALDKLEKLPFFGFPSHEPQQTVSETRANILDLQQLRKNILAGRAEVEKLKRELAASEAALSELEETLVAEGFKLA